MVDGSNGGLGFGAVFRMRRRSGSGIPRRAHRFLIALSLTPSISASSTRDFVRRSSSSSESSGHVIFVGMTLRLDGLLSPIRFSLPIRVMDTLAKGYSSPISFCKRSLLYELPIPPRRPMLIYRRLADGIDPSLSTYALYSRIRTSRVIRSRLCLPMFLPAYVSVNTWQLGHSKRKLLNMQLARFPSM